MDICDVLGVNNIEDINNIIKNGNKKRMINMQESYHEIQISKIANQICNKDTDLRLVLITGPSSSGKTTFSDRLSIHIELNGKKAVRLSLDDYFIAIDEMPKHEDGTYNFEEIECIEYELFNKNLRDLISGGCAYVPEHSFSSGRAKDLKKIMIGCDDIILVEGIHAFDPMLTSLVSDENKFHIFLLLDSELSIENEKISTTDTRFLRRMIRDYHFRLSAPEHTFSMWWSVRKGEIKNILPHKDKSDVSFSTFSVYEYNVFKEYAVPLLNSIEKSSKYYEEAQRLLSTLSKFENLSTEFIPSYSFIREFIGGSSISY